MLRESLMLRSSTQKTIDEIVSDACDRLSMVTRGRFIDGKIVYTKETATSEDVDVYIFPQTWGDTSCGFGGVAGQAFTKSTTVVVILEDQTDACVYFSGRFAYKVSPVTREFLTDLGNFNMAEVYKRSRYREKTAPKTKPD